MKTRMHLCLSLISMIFFTSPLVSADQEIKHVVELFTSQGCYSCPPADKLLGSIVKNNKNTIALEFHVDYWDSLVYGSAGQWKDPFSSASYSKRQRDYNRLLLEGRTGVYTPQMIVDGSYAFVGSQRSTLQRQLKRESNLVLNLSAKVSTDGGITVQVDGPHESTADVWLITFDRKNVTNVKAGENKGAQLVNFNVVRNFESIGKLTGETSETFTIQKSLNEHQNCAVIVQEFNPAHERVAGPIIGAANCERQLSVNGN